ncbi:MAG: TlpA family protein disulfide reductase [Alistipes sp.]|nr:TlpA family protein disulfide reductase [Alistipes sp.]
MARRHQKKSIWNLIIMGIIVIVICAALLFGGSFRAKAQQQRPTPEQATLVKEGQKAPAFEVEMFDGSTVKLADLKGKVVLLNFWATWCPPCRAELARVEKEIIEKFKGKPFVFLPVSRGEKRDTVAAFREKMGYAFPMGLDTEGRVYAEYAQTYIPRNFLIDKQGNIVKASVGYDEAEFAELVKLIEETIKK